MYRVPPDRAWWPAVGAPLERGVRPQRAPVLSGQLFREVEQVQSTLRYWTLEYGNYIFGGFAPTGKYVRS